MSSQTSADTGFVFEPGRERQHAKHASLLLSVSQTEGRETERKEEREIDKEEGEL